MSIFLPHSSAAVLMFYNVIQLHYFFQVYHFCLHDGNKFSFLCPNGTMFNQAYFVCDLWFNVDCARATDFYSLNENIYKNPEVAPEKATSYS